MDFIVATEREFEEVLAVLGVGVCWGWGGGESIDRDLDYLTSRFHSWL